MASSFFVDLSIGAIFHEMYESVAIRINVTNFIVMMFISTIGIEFCDDLIMKK